MEEQSTRRP